LNGCWCRPIQETHAVPQ